MPDDILTNLKNYSNPKKAKILSRFFKTGIGEYGEGDKFLGVVVPDIRKIAKKHVHLSLNEIEKHLHSNFHEERMCVLLILVEQFKKDTEKQKKIFEFYLKNTEYINSWDLVDLSAPSIVGVYLSDKDKKEKEVLYKLSKSENLWEKRISIISTLSFIKQNKFKDTFEISKILLKDKHDLIHKAIGWMLREVGKRNLDEEEKFLKENNRYKTMPRTMLRYAIEKFPEEKRKKYLNGEI